VEIIDTSEIDGSAAGVPIYNWAEAPEVGALEQIGNLSRLPFAIDHVALMPDAHQGYGMPIGGVLFAEKAVVPNAIGVDIGCGVTLIEANFYAWDLLPADVKAILDQVARDVPVGNGPGGGHKHAEAPWQQDNSDVSPHARAAVEDAWKQLGSLGGGNHFLELQADEDQKVYFMIHSGSRSVGKKVCDYHHEIALRMNRRWHSALPSKDLAYLPLDSDEGQQYLIDMNHALLWAEENRRRMAGKVISALGKVKGISAWQTLDVHHNFAAFENHMGRNGIVHRKGSVRARAGETVLIPGSMSTGSYIAEGLGNPLSFETCQHGAGRARSRAATRKMITVEQMDADLEAANVTLVTPSRQKVTDEVHQAYKDIESVMAASTDLVRPTKRLRPIGVVKG
jgi:tRNA-splicing ligase RtcB